MEFSIIFFIFFLNPSLTNVLNLKINRRKSQNLSFFTEGIHFMPSLIQNIITTYNSAFVSLEWIGPFAPKCFYRYNYFVSQIIIYYGCFSCHLNRLFQLGYRRYQSMVCASLSIWETVRMALSK